MFIPKAIVNLFSLQRMRKVDTGLNAADMMTKNVGVGVLRVQPGRLEMHVPIVGLIEELTLLDVILHRDFLLHAFSHHSLKPGYCFLCSFDFQMLKMKEGSLSCYLPQF